MYINKIKLIKKMGNHEIVIFSSKLNMIYAIISEHTH